MINNNNNNRNKKSNEKWQGQSWRFQAFGTTIAKALILVEAFQYLNTFNNLDFFSIGTLDGELQQSKKLSLEFFSLKIQILQQEAYHQELHDF